MKRIDRNGKTQYECEECSLHYTNEDTALRCEAYCREHKACSSEITKEAVEMRER